MEVKPGYKQTEVGVIPEAWDTKRVCEFASVITGGTPRTEVQAYWNGGYPWVTPTDITDQRDMWASERMISESGLSAIRQLPANAVLVTCIASIGKNAILRSVGGCNQQINAVVPKLENSPEFLYYTFESSKQYLLANAGMTATRILSKASFEQLKFAIPLPPEQRAIATALSDVDGLLGGLDQLIAKKRDLKQATMQQLLTGQIRLPGHSGKWTTTSLSAVTTRLSGYWGTDRADSSHTKRVSVVRAGDISVDGKLEATATRYFSSFEFGKSEVKQGDVLLTGSGSVGKVWWCAGARDLAASNFVRILRPDVTKIDGKFLYQLLLSNAVQQIIKGHIAVGVLANLGTSFFNSEWLECPSLPEQRAIATVLFDIDSEIATLEARRDKTRAIKQGMMQELLSGRIRLLQPEALHA